MKLVVLAALMAVGTPPAAAKVFLSREAALAQVFGPSCRLETRSIFLTPGQVRAAESAAGARLASARVVAYRALRGDTLVGTAYLDTHPVRTLHETILIAVTPGGAVAAVEVLAFHEPEDYLPPRRWLDRFAGHELSRDLRPGAAVPHLGGATLTARALAAAVRRTLALHAVIGADSRR